MIRALALCLIASPAIAADSATWCGGLGMASITEDGAGYLVTVVNAYCPAGAWADSLEVVQLSAPGIRITLQIWSEPGMVPDAFHALPPAGWLADPAELIVDEHQQGVIRISPVGLS